MKSTNRVFCAFAALTFSIGIYAQSGTNSPYSQYGLGVLSDQTSGFNRGMNGVGLGFREHNQVNFINPASYSAVDSLSFIFDVGFSGQITNWKEVGGDDATIVVLNRKAGSGTRATFEAAVFGDEAVDFKGDAELDKSGDVQTQMASTDNAISYLDFSHFDDSKFNAIKVEGVEPKSENVTDDSFKIWATEHMYCSKDADEATKAFLDFMLSDDVQGKLVEEQGFIPVSAMKVVKDASGKVSSK